MKAAAAVLLALFLSACGGGGSVRPDPPVTPPATYRADLLFGYYGGCETCAVENRNHTNLYWSPGWNGLQGTIAELRAAGGERAVVLAVPAYVPNAESETRAFLTGVRDAGLLSRIVALYPIDEPDVLGKGDAEVRATNAMLRRVMSEYAELANTKLAVIYGCGTGKRPGLSSYDWVGCDEYGDGCWVMGGDLATLRAALTPEQRLMLVPGGASPWRQSPACFETYAHENPVVVAIIPFLWQTVTGRNIIVGIRDNGMAPAYCAVGRRIIAPLEVPSGC